MGALDRRNTRYPLADLKTTNVAYNPTTDITTLKVTFSSGPGIHLDLPKDNTTYLTGVASWLTANSKAMQFGKK